MTQRLVFVVLLIGICLMLAACVCVSTRRNVFVETEMPASELPSAIIAYSYLCRWHPDIVGSTTTPPFETLNKEFGRWPRIAPLVHSHAFILANGQKAEFHAVNRLDIGDLSGDALFVTMPIALLGHKVLAVFSSQNPDRTAIYAVDHQLHVERLYDSFEMRRTANDIPGAEHTLGFVFAVQNVSPGKYILWDRGGGKPYSLDSYRSFVFKVRKTEDGTATAIEMLPFALEPSVSHLETGK